MIVISKPTGLICEQVILNVSSGTPRQLYLHDIKNSNTAVLEPDRAGFFDQLTGVTRILCMEPPQADGGDPTTYFVGLKYAQLNDRG